MKLFLRFFGFLFAVGTIFFVVGVAGVAGLLWHYSKDLPDDRGGKTLMYATWPKSLTDEEKKYFGLDESADKVAAAKYELVSMGRNLRRELKLDPAKKWRMLSDCIHSKAFETAVWIDPRSRAPARRIVAQSRLKYRGPNRAVNHHPARLCLPQEISDLGVPPRLRHHI